MMWEARFWSQMHGCEIEMTLLQHEAQKDPFKVIPRGCHDRAAWSTLISWPTSQPEVPFMLMGLQQEGGCSHSRSIINIWLCCKVCKVSANVSNAAKCASVCRDPHRKSRTHGIRWWCSYGRYILKCTILLATQCPCCFHLYHQQSRKQ